MKKLKIITLTLIIFMCGISPVFAKNKPKNNTDYRQEYLNISWWQKYNDEILTDYMRTAYKNNQDLKIASIKTKQAQQVVRQSFAAELPQVGFHGNIFRDLRSSNLQFGDLVIPNFSQSNFVLPLTMTYEADIWGENRLKTKSIQKQADMIKQDERAAYIAITSAVASTYFNLIKADKLIKNQTELINIQKKVLSLVEKKHQCGLCPITEVLQEKQTLTMIEEQLNNYKEKQDVLSNQLIVMLGDRNIKDVTRSEYNHIMLIEIPDGINAEVISNRPDLIKTEEYVQKIGLDVKVAHRDFLPKFTLYGQLGFSAYDWGKMFMNNTVKSNVGVMPSLDLFTGGAKVAHLKYQKLEYQKASQIYEKTLLTSIQELNDSMVSAKTAKKNYSQSVERNNLEKNKYALSEKKLAIGAKSNLDNLRAREVLIMSETAEISTKIDYLISTINIYKAVGGKDFIRTSEDI